MKVKELAGLIKPALEGRPYAPSDAATAVPSAVLIIIHYHPGDTELPRIILTRRSANVRSHSSEISFPGGRHSNHDASLLHTALRETKEEIGLGFADHDILGSLAAVHTMTSNHFIVPFVTLQRDLPEQKIEVSEVEAVLDLPLLETLQSMTPDIEHFGLARDAVKFGYGGNVIWGATARILKQLHNMLIRPS
ncbi:MAG TPA: CoA pyrophosphatase [Nitrososphaera sp.]|nr:CoA pyrophosphatase [Nitrososphaera sp.]